MFVFVIDRLDAMKHSHSSRVFSQTNPGLYLYDIVECHRKLISKLKNEYRDVCINNKKKSELGIVASTTLYATEKVRELFGSIRKQKNH